MSVYIKDMKMPQNCDHCFVTPGCCPAIRKRIKSDTPGYTWIPANYRHEDCPLIPVQEPHGRLIDADALQTSTAVPLNGKSFRYVHVNNINNAPTIIPASEEAAE